MQVSRVHYSPQQRWVQLIIARAQNHNEDSLFKVEAMRGLVNTGVAEVLWLDEKDHLL